MAQWVKDLASSLQRLGLVMSPAPVVFIQQIFECLLWARHCVWCWEFKDEPNSDVPCPHEVYSLVGARQATNQYPVVSATEETEGGVGGDGRSAGTPLLRRY